MEVLFDFFVGPGWGEVEGGLVEAAFEVVGGWLCDRGHVDIGAAFGHGLEIGVGAALGEVAEVEAVAAEDFGEVAFGGEGEVVADEVDGTIVFGRGKQAGDFEALAGFGGHVFCLADGVLSRATAYFSLWMESSALLHSYHQRKSRA